MAAFMDPRDANQRAARALGYTGAFGTGGIDQWRLQNNISDSAFQGAGGYKPLDAQMASSRFTGGVSPVGTVEPLNEYQRSALTELAQPLPNVPDYGLVQRGTQQMTDADFMSGYNRYSNPYTQDVINRTIGGINDQGAQDRARLVGGNAGSRSFGNSSMAIQLSQLDNNMRKQIGDTTASLNYQNNAQATQNALGQWNTERNRDLSGQGVNIATTQAMNDISQNNMRNKLGAGEYIQGQNQKMLSAVQPQIQGLTNQPYNSMSLMAQYLGQIPGSSVGGQAGQPSMMSQIGQGVSGLGLLGSSGIFGNSGRQYVDGLPWLS